MDKTSLSLYVLPTDKNEFERIVQEEKSRERRRTIGDIFHDMIETYKQRAEAN